MKFSSKILLKLLVCLPITLFAKEWTLSDKNLQVTFNDQTSVFKVLDKRCNKVWQQTMLDDGLVLSKVTQGTNSLRIAIGGKSKFTAEVMLTKESELAISLSGDEAMPMDTLQFPGAFASPKKHYLLLNDGAGLLLPVEDKAYPLGSGVMYFCGGGNAMAWTGIVDKNFSVGYMAIVETPYDAALKPLRQNGLATFQPVWLPSMGKLGYTRKIRYVFFNKGGYVSQCKRYRNYIWQKNGLITLKEKQQRFPAIAKITGAPHIYVWDDARQVAFAKELKASGIDKAFLLWNPNHTPYPERDYYNKLKELGYAGGLYELFTDLKLRDTVAKPFDESGPLRFALTAYPGLFHSLAARNKHGKTHFNQFGHTACPVAIRQQMEKRIQRELKEYNPESYFLDVYQANGLFECYSPEHPLTRQQFAEAATQNYKTLEDKYNQFMGGEWGAEFTGSSSIYNHGMMTLQRTWWGTGAEKKGTIYYSGDWRNNSRPTQMLGSRVATDTYLKYSVSEYLRVPLYELVYHDASLSSWRWEDGNHHSPEIWWKKDLFNVLYGTVPLWSIDRSRWEEYKQTFIESYKYICPWLEQIAYDELVSHRFVTADHKVQESTFSSGKKVVVNFGDEPVIANGKTIKARGFITY